MIDLSATIAPKSEQLNSDDLLAGPRTITITAVKVVAEDQPVAIHFAGDEGKTWKPCKSMRRLMVKAWGADGAKYVGKSMTLYTDDGVLFGGKAVGGIRISHMSGIDKPLTMALTATRAVKKAFTVKPLAVVAPTATDDDTAAWVADISGAESVSELKVIFASAWKLASGPEEKSAFKTAYDARAAALITGAAS